MLVAAAGLLLGLHGAATWSARREPRWTPWTPRRPARVPVVTLLVAGVALAAAFGQATPHQARTVARQASPTSLRAAVDTWLDREATSSDYVPMILVGATGGELKAAYWTDLVLDCVLGDGVPDEDTGDCRSAATDAPRLGRVILTSSVSGGSVGVYHLMTNLAKVRDGTPWVDTTVGREVLSPITAPAGSCRGPRGGATWPPR